MALCGAIRRLSLGALVIASLGAALRARAAPHLDVSGVSRFEARAAPAHGAVVVSGTLLDDADRPVAAANVRVSFVSAGGSALVATACDDGGVAPTRAPQGDAEVTTLADGRFCARANAPPGTTTIALAWDGTPALAGTHLELSVDPSRRVVRLALDPEPRIISLGAGAIAIDAVANVEGENGAGSPEGLPLHLADERGATLGDVVTDRSGRGHFVVDEAILGPPGPGELRLSFDGNAEDAPAQSMTPCERHAAVRVTPHGSPGPDIVVGVEEDDGVGVDFDVRTERGEPVGGGSVEATSNGAAVAVAPSVLGHAHLVARGLDRGATDIEVRYIPDAPWLVASSAATFSIRVRRTIVWRRLAVFAGGLAILAWFFVARSRLFAPRRTPEADTGTGDPDGGGRVEVLARKGGSRTGWEGTVVDAHDETLVANATVTLERAGFGGLEVLATTTADAAGRFVLPGERAQPGDQIAAEGRFHRRLIKTAPPSSVLEVALESRRRVLVRRLVRWAKRRGAPFDVAPDATPGHVNRVAGSDAQTALWALAVEEAAFGKRDVDAALETEVLALGHQDDEAAPKG